MYGSFIRRVSPFLQFPIAPVYPFNGVIPTIWGRSVRVMGLALGCGMNQGGAGRVENFGDVVEVILAFVFL